MGNPNAVPIHLHDKVCIVDDRLLRIGSSNITNRSMGLDNECDLAIESDHGETHAAIIEVRNRLLAEHLGCSPRDVQTSVERSGSLVQAIEQLRGGARSLLHYHDNGSALAHRVLPEAALVDPDRPISMERVGRAIRRDERLYKRLRAIGLAWWGVMLVVLVIGNVAGWIDAASLAQWLSEFATESVWGVLTVPIAFVIAGLFFVPVTLMIANCGALFGAWVGGVYALLGALSSAAVYFFLGRWVGMGTVQRIASLRLQRAMRAIASRGILAVAAIRVVPIAPHLVVGLAAGAARIRFRDYMLGTIVAMAPGTLVLTLLGQHFSHGMASPSPTAMVTMVVLIAVGLALAWLMQRWLGNPLRAGARPPPQPEGHDAERPDVGALAGRYRRRFASESSVE
jgi:uncharacterized membrane protein YdjX (TVP38/TMEM64 family)